ncbi:MAG: hypothetical protein Fur0037_04150 [Planctomycetota bacterium]
MQELLRLLASWKGVAVEDGAELRFEFSSFPSGSIGLLVILGVLLALSFVVFIYRRDGRNLSLGRRCVLAALRMIAVLAAVLLLLEPDLVAVKRETRPGHAILLLDQSQSMARLDPWRKEDVQSLAEAWREIGVDDPSATSRIDLAKALLRWGDGQLVSRLGARNKVQLYGFAGGLSALPTAAPEEPVSARASAEPRPVVDPPPKVDIGKIAATGRSTNIGGSLRTALEKSRSSEIAAVVLLTDGRRNAGPQGAEIARLLGQRKVPHTFVLGIGDPSETQTVGIARFEAPEKVFQKDPFALRAVIRSQGYEKEEVTVRLVRIDEKGLSSAVQTRRVEIGGSEPEQTVEFSGVTSEETGRFAYRVEISPPDGEPPTPERHSRSAVVDVIGSRTRVLLLAGGANHEFQILRNFLIRDQTIDVSCWLQSADPGFPQDGDPDARIEKLPATRAEWDRYDVAILIDPDSTKLDPSFGVMLRRQVLENGCGLWWVAGEKFTLKSLRPESPLRPVADLLPVLPDLRAAEVTMDLGHAYPTAWPWRLTPEGEDGIASKVAKIAESKDESRMLWGRLPGFHFAFPVAREKPAATVIAEHGNPALHRGDHGMPLVVTQFVGAGRVLFTGTDETCRWRSSHENAYDRFWVNGIRFLFEGRLGAGNSRLRLLVSTEKLELGDPVRISAEAKDEQYHALIAEGIDLSMEREGGQKETLRLLPVEESPGRFEAAVRPTSTGFYHVRSVQEFGREVEAGFEVVPAVVESEGPMDRSELAALANCPGGRLCETPRELLAALDDIPSRSATDTFRTPHAIWDGWATIAIAIAVLGLEWYLRKRFNLL